ncbi:MAG: LysR family transcriptional regulator [Victivallales bacterium]|nr:LysR family transcriptional regulator [Victivallales bacterium]
MELMHLRYFVAVAEELHFGRAAQRLHMAQPPLSQQIMKLEDELEVKLFTRSSRKVELTSAGKIFLEDSRDILKRAEVSRRAMRELSTGARGALSLGFNEPAINTFLSATVREFIDTYPEVKLSLLELETAEQIEALNMRQIHLGIMRPFGYDLGAFQQRRLWTEKYLLALPESHPLCEYETISPLQLKNEKFIMFPRSLNPALFNCITEAFETYGFRPRVVQDAVSKQTTLALVEAGLGVALVPQSSSHLAPHGVKFIAIEDANTLPTVEINAVWLNDISPQVILNFLNIVEKHLR